MTNKIYRLADERDVGKPVLFFQDLKSALKGESSILSLLGDITEVYYTAKPRVYYTGTGIDPYAFRFAFVEVTPADFSIEQLCETLIEKGYSVELNNSTKYIKGVIPKEKTLADFSDEELYTEIRSRSRGNLTMLSKAYKNGYDACHKKMTVKVDLPDTFLPGYAKGYESGKRDAEPKWISVNERLPAEDKSYWCASKQCHEYDDKGPVSLLTAFLSGRFQTNREITHWMESLSPPTEPQLEQKTAEKGKRDAEPKWISIDGMRPSYDTRVLVIYSTSFFGCIHNKITIGCLSSEDNKWYAEDKKFINKIPSNLISGATHWMPIPNPPIESQPEQKPEESKYTCAQCSKIFAEKGDKFCSEKCTEDYEWIDAEFPRDWDKECRVKDFQSQDWTDDLIIVGRDNNSDLPFITSNDATYRYCQVRRDSVEEK